MFDSTIPKTSTFCWIGLVGMLLTATPSRLWSQKKSTSLPTYSSAGEVFAGLDDSLNSAATALLDNAIRTTPPATGKALILVPALREDQGPEHRIRGSAGVAASRLSTLRPMVEPILRSHGVPGDLSAMILVESGGQATALSPKGARGLWQLMPETARRYGLRVDDTQDDRVDPLKATEAAARYLHDLYVTFGDWKLALAAYDAGEVNVGNAISKAHTQDFDQLARLRMLPLETRNYVPLVLAAMGSPGQPSLLAQSHEKNTSITVFASSNR